MIDFFEKLPEHIRQIQPPAIPTPAVSQHLIWDFIAAVLFLLVGVALWRTRIGQALIVAALIIILLLATGHLHF